MKVYIAQYCFYDTSEVIGVFTSADVAEKYIEQSIRCCFGTMANTQMLRSRYYVSIKYVIGE